MIDVINSDFISDDDRRLSFQRALHSYPYFYHMDFVITPTTEIVTRLARTLGINRDFYLTEVLANYDETTIASVNITNNITLWTGYNESLFGIQAQELLPRSMVSVNAKARDSIGQLSFNDQQFEFPPKLIKNDDYITGQIQNTQLLTADGTTRIVLKGFSLLDNAYLTDMETQQINDSLANPVQWQTFNIDVPSNATYWTGAPHTFSFKNDRYPRLMLGMMSANDAFDQAHPTNVNILSMTDLTRRIEFLNRDIPLEFLAPRVPPVRDDSIYYLPIEYYLQPYAEIQIIFTETRVGGRGGGFSIGFLTRTV